MFDMGGGGHDLYGEDELLRDIFYDDLVQSLFEPNDAANNYTTCTATTGVLPMPYLECYPIEHPFVSTFPPEFDNQCYLDCCYQNPKRQKTNSYYNDLHYSLNTFSQYPDDEFFFSKTEQQIQLPSMIYASSTTEKKKKSLSSTDDKGLSAQSVAARQRRRKISEKTQKLGKLIPRSNRMNSTADMFQAAYKYVQYLQAQVGILQLMQQEQQGSQENVVAPIVEEGLEVLLASPTIQEKLYSEEKCLVPQNFVESLAKDNETIKSSIQGVILPLES